MNNLKNIAILLLLLSAVFGVRAAEKTYMVKGSVFAFDKTPIDGAMITSSDKTVSSVKTDEKGNYEIKLYNLKGELTIWSPGYLTQKVAIHGRTIINAVLVPLNQPGLITDMLLPNQGMVNIDQKMGGVSVLDKANMNENVKGVEQSLSQLSGVQVRQMGGMPGDGTYFDFRGVRTFVGNNQPLIVLNGVPMLYNQRESEVIGGYSKSIFNGINPVDIRNITVLKGSEASVYGSMASNGVILIETDRATDMDTKVEFYGQYGVDMNQSRLQLLDVNQYKSLVTDVAWSNLDKYQNMGNILELFPFIADMDNPSYYYKYLYNNNTDWQDQIYRAGFITDNTLKIKGGDAIAKFDASIGIQSLDGQMSGTNFQRYIARINSDVQLSRTLKFSATLSANFQEADVMNQGMNLEISPLMAAYRKGPIFSPYTKNVDGTLSPSYSNLLDPYDKTVIAENNQVSNPLAIINDALSHNKEYDVNMNAMLSYQIVPELRLSGTFGLYYNMARSNLFIPGATNRNIMPLMDGIANNMVIVGVEELINTYYGFNANYAKKFNRVHDFKADFGGQYIFTRSEFDNGQGINTSGGDYFKTLDKVNGAVGRRIYGGIESWNWMNYYVSARYVYDNLLGVNFSGALDAASSIGEDTNLFQFYPAATVVLYGKGLPGLKDASWTDQLNVRYDISTSGNSQYSTLLSKHYYTGSNTGRMGSIVRPNIPNKKLNAEYSVTNTFGLDLSFFNRRLDVTADYYFGQINNVIVDANIGSGNGVSKMKQNAATIGLNGFELAVQGVLYRDRISVWTLGATFSTYNNVVKSLGNGLDAIITELPDGSAIITEVGKAPYSFYGYKTNGVFSTTTQAKGSGLVTSGGVPFQAGDVIFVDKESNSIINDKDRFNLGSADPKFFGSIYTTFKHRNLKISATIGYTYGNKAYNAVRQTLESMSDYGNQLVSTSQRWTTEGDVTNMPRAAYGDPMDNNRFSDRFIEDASYLKLKEVLVSYDFKLLNGLTVYAAGENLLTFTNYLGSDPEIAYSYNPMYRGFDYGKLPLGRAVKLGVRIQF